MDRLKKYRLLLGVLLIFTAICAFRGPVLAKVYIDINAPNFQQFPIAVSDFHIQGQPGQQRESSSNIAESIRFCLSLSGVFNVLDKKSFLDGVEPGLSEKIRFSDWTMVGADFLLQGDLLAKGVNLEVAGRLYDVARGQMLFNKQYAGRSNDLPAIARTIATDILFELTGEKGDFNTRIAFVNKKNARQDIYVMNYDGSDLERATSHQSIVASPRWSPDGRYLAFTSYKSGRPEIYLRHMQTGKERKISSFEGLNLCGSFSPDSKKLLLTLSMDGNEEIYALDIDTLSLQRLTRSYAIDVSPAWSPDGKKIAFVSNRSGSPQIFTMDADGGNVKRVTYEGSYNTSPSWSPRGGKLAYESLLNRKCQIFTVDEDGSKPTQLTFGNVDNEYPTWSPSGRQILFSSRQGGKSRISIMNANGSNIRVLKEEAARLAMPVWSPGF